jgi:hypothetical protein
MISLRKLEGGKDVFPKKNRENVIETVKGDSE